MPIGTFRRTISLGSNVPGSRGNTMRQRIQGALQGGRSELVGFRYEYVTDNTGQVVSVELLADMGGAPLSVLLTQLRTEGRTLTLLEPGIIQAWLLHADIHSGYNPFGVDIEGLSGIILCVNAYLSDISNIDFPDFIKGLLADAKLIDKKKLLIEILEVGHSGDITTQLFYNIRRLNHLGIEFAVDDYDILDNKVGNISRELFDALWSHGSLEGLPRLCNRLKLDYEITDLLLAGDTQTHQALLALLKKYPGVIITAEGIKQDSDEITLATFGITFFQHYSRGNSRFGDL